MDNLGGISLENDYDVTIVMCNATEMIWTMTGKQLHKMIYDSFKNSKNKIIIWENQLVVIEKITDIYWHTEETDD